ncbi:hypothetical protein H6F76_14240 [Leptolyngbya sp. FACHB-321]|nr:hypothetical protein [Leptolyngbya sp. FACHB-321]
MPNLLMVREFFPDPTDWLSGSVVVWSVGIEYRLYGSVTKTNGNEQMA